jgi:hypothetical protein
MGLRIAIWRISARFFSPPEKPSFGSGWRRSIHLEERHLLRSISRNSFGGSFSSPPPSRAWSAAGEFAMPPGIAVGIGTRGRSLPPALVFPLRHVLAAEEDLAGEKAYFGFPMRAFAVLFRIRSGHEAWISPCSP